MSKGRSMSFQFLSRAVPSVPAAPKIVTIEEKVSVDDVFAALERRAAQGVVEFVTFECVGMTAASAA